MLILMGVQSGYLCAQAVCVCRTSTLQVWTCRTTEGCPAETCTSVGSWPLLGADSWLPPSGGCDTLIQCPRAAAWSTAGGGGVSAAACWPVTACDLMRDLMGGPWLFPTLLPCAVRCQQSLKWCETRLGIIAWQGLSYDGTMRTGQLRAAVCTKHGSLQLEAPLRMPSFEHGLHATVSDQIFCACQPEHNAWRMLQICAVG